MAHQLVFRVHALQAMFERNISAGDVHAVVLEGKVVESYPQDRPYNSRLILGWRGPRPIHVVAADDSAGQETIIITVYEPDPERWEPGFERRKRT